MKKTQFILFTGALLLLSGLQGMQAQSFKTTDAKIVKIIADTTYMTAMEVTFPPGYKTNLHTHPAQFIYAVTDGTLSVAYADGRKEEISVKAGDSFSAPPDAPHMTTNKGTMPAKFIIVELNEHPYKEMKKKK